ncbi:MAG: sialidase family protein, partial [Planctomycetia bacterium]|nr:sialidase family protein [Planctomycetia bacterium]
MKKLPVHSFLMLFLFTLPVLAEKTPTLENARVVLELSPGEGNPRNSEGDFVRLKNGDILLVYSHYTGQSAGDHEKAHIAGRISHDRGETWSDPFPIREVEKGGMNLMSVSLLRLQDGRIALFYLRKYSLQDTRPFVCFSEDEGKTWTIPQPCIGEAEKGYYVVNNGRVIQLADGSILIPCALHPIDSRGNLSWNATLICYISTNNG